MGPAPRRTIFLHEYVTGGGLAGAALPRSWAAEGGAMRRALAADFASLPGVRVVMTLDDRLPDEPGPWEIARIGPGEERDAFARRAAEADYTALIAPETGGLLFDRARLIEQVGGRPLGADPGAILLAGDKWALGEHLTAQGVPTPPCRRVVPAEGLPDEGIYPAVLKPPDGAGAVDTFLVASGIAPLPDDAMRMPEALLQPFVPGTPMSASFLVDARGRAQVVGVCRQRIDGKGGRFSYRGGTVPAGEGVPLDPVARAIDLVAGLRGWVGVDFLWDETRRHVTVLEVNPRPTTSYVGFRRLLAPGELAAAWLRGIEGTTGATPDSLDERIREHAPLTFAADGTILGDHPGEFPGS